MITWETDAVLRMRCWRWYWRPRPVHWPTNARLVDGCGDVPALEVIAHQAVGLEEGPQHAVGVEGAEGSAAAPGISSGPAPRRLCQSESWMRQLPPQLSAEGLLLCEEELELEQVAQIHRRVPEGVGGALAALLGGPQQRQLRDRRRDRKKWITVLR